MSAALLEEWVWAFGGATGRQQQQTLSHAYPTSSHLPGHLPSLPAERRSGWKPSPVPGMNYNWFTPIRLSFATRPAFFAKEGSHVT